PLDGLRRAQRTHRCASAGRAGRAGPKGTMCARRCARAAGGGGGAGAGRPRGTGARPRRGWAPPPPRATVRARRGPGRSAPAAPGGRGPAGAGLIVHYRPMPELPEVEAARRLLVRTTVGRRIVSVNVVRDPIVFQGVSPAHVRRALVGRRVVAAHRHGKHLWLELNGRPWPCFHFGMSGEIGVGGQRRGRLMTEGRRAHRDVWPPRFLKLHLVLDDGTEVAFRDARRLGRVRLRHDPRAEPPISLLGFDALHQLPPLRRLSALLGARAAPVKAGLLDQSFSAGGGNWVDEQRLYPARSNPRRRARTRTAAEVGRLRARLRSVVALAVRVGADSDKFPAKWLFHTRWSKRLKSPMTPRGERIRYLTVGGRTTAWVAEVQH